MRFLLALQFLTCVPLRIRGPVEEEDLAASMAWYPLVGLILGAAAAGVYLAAAFVAPTAMADFLPLAFLVVVTGNMHGDGLMDATDGLGSGRPGDRVLEIMHDTRVGAHGVMAALLGFLAKLFFLGTLAPDGKVAALFLVPALGRWALVYGAWTNPYVRPGQGKGGFLKFLTWREMVWASATVVAALLWTAQARGLVLGLVGWAAAHLAGCYFRKRIGGVTGDTLGALNEFVEVTGLATMVILQRFWP